MYSPLIHTGFLELSENIPQIIPQASLGQCDIRFPEAGISEN